MNGHHKPYSQQHHQQNRVLRPGIYAPMPSFFLPGSEDLDIPTFSAHVVRIARAGVGILVAGSMGEAHHLSSAERNCLIAAARSALDAADMHDAPIIAGTGMAGTRLTIELTREAAEAGADAAIVISSGYFAAALDKAAQRQLFTDVADASPIPIMIYNYPGATGGLDIESDVLEDLARHPNICGVKLTCGNVGKLTRVGAHIASQQFVKTHPRSFVTSPGGTPFLVLGGYADFLLPSLFAFAHGAITGLGNVAPRSIARVFDLASQGQIAEAQRLQGIVAEGDRTIAVTGVAGTKALLQRAHGYGGVPRRPLLPTPPAVVDALWAHPHVRALLDLEAQLELEAQEAAAPVPAEIHALNGNGITAAPLEVLVNGS